ncbi:transglutaminase domain-containing protein [Granulicoccus sp. GXG6511]|uniref:transglutaminase domain-containing protein n=1 Tax=Granulicoccus sp. GXG6511 TaxID=3381351 RepID=UPI003D7E99EE
MSGARVVRRSVPSSKRIMIGAGRYVLVPVQPRPADIPVATWQELARLNDYVIDHVRYDRSRVGAAARRADRHQTPAETLRIGRGVCQDFTALFEALAAERGHTVRSLRSARLNHAWNEVLIAGRWWVVDVTWNSAELFLGGARVPERVRSDPDFRKRYFLTTVEREEALQRAGLLRETHRAPDVARVDYARTSEAYAILDILSPLVARRNALVASRTATRREIDGLDARIVDLHRRYRVLAQAHPLAVRYTLT